MPDILFAALKLAERSKLIPKWCLVTFSEIVITFLLLAKPISMEGINQYVFGAFNYYVRTFGGGESVRMRMYANREGRGCVNANVHL